MNARSDFRIHSTKMSKHHPREKESIPLYKYLLLVKLQQRIRKHQKRQADSKNISMTKSIEVKSNPQMSLRKKASLSETRRTHKESFNKVSPELKITRAFESNYGKQPSFSAIKWDDNSWFIGSIINDQANGYGIFNHVLGDRYEGEFQNDVSSGFGIYSNTNHKSKCIGEWKEDMQHGIGIEHWADNSRYVGCFLNGKKNGIGTYEWHDGSKYEGEWKDGALSGLGIYYFSDKRAYYGNWKSNMMNGFGEFHWKNKLYIGEYSNDKKEGFGIYFWYDPPKAYIGMWKGGKQNGIGKLMTSKQGKFGIWKNGERQVWLSREDISREENMAMIKDNLKYLKYFEMDINELRSFCTGFSI